jgi:aryl-alcohol dehydrogenase-like predicted oxidoreductase
MQGHSLTDYVTLGRSGLRVSPICLGAMTFGTEWNLGTDAAESDAMISQYLEAGGNFIDTANMYNKGHSEKILGDYFTRGPGRGKRHRAVIASKFMGNMWPKDPNGGGAGRKAIRHAVEDSLRRLQTDHIDLLWAHFWDQHTPVEEMMAELDRLVKAGKVLHLGLSDHPAWVCVKCQYTAMMRGWEPLCALQIEYSLLQRSVECELMSMARDLNLGVTPWSPLRGGVLSGKFDRSNPPRDDGSTRVKKESAWLNEKTFLVIDALKEIAAARGATVAQVALRWLLDQDGVTSVIIGARRPSQLKDNLGACAVRLTAEDHATLHALTKPERPFPWEFLDFVRNAIQNGATINGRPSEVWDASPKSDAERH